MLMAPLLVLLTFKWIKYTGSNIDCNTKIYNWQDIEQYNVYFPIKYDTFTYILTKVNVLMYIPPKIHRSDEQQGGKTIEAQKQ